MACTYPEFGFVPDDAPGSDTTGDDSGAGLDARADSSTSDTAPGDSTIDTTSGDTTSADTTPGDSTPTDTKVTDSATPADTTPPVDTGTTFCTTGPIHFFCNDFESSTIVTYGWTSDYTTPPDGTIALESSASCKSGKCLRSVLTAPGAGSFSAASVNRNIAAPSAGALTRFEADMRLDAAVYTGTEGTLLMKLQRTGGDGIGFGIDPDGYYLEMVGTSYHYHQLVAPVVGGAWVHVKIEGTLVTAGGSATVWIDGGAPETFTAESTGTSDGTSRNLVVGFYADAPIASFGARFDNVTLDFP